MKGLFGKKIIGIVMIIIVVIGLLLIAAISGNTKKKESTEENTFVIVTSCSADEYESIFLEFQQRCPCRIKVIEKSEEEIYSELRANGGKLEGDVIFGISENLTEKSRQSFAAYKPFMQTEMVIVYSLNVIEQREAPKSLMDLGDIKWKGTIGCVHESTDFMYENIKKYADTYGMSESQWSDFQSNIAVYADSEDDVADGILEGKYLVGIVSKEKALMMTKEDSSVKYCKPGKEGCPLRFDVCIPRECSQPEWAAQFLAFCGSSSMEQYLAEFLYFERVDHE